MIILPFVFFQLFAPLLYSRAYQGLRSPLRSLAPCSRPSRINIRSSPILSDILPFRSALRPWYWRSIPATNLISSQVHGYEKLLDDLPVGRLQYCVNGNCYSKLKRRKKRRIFLLERQENSADVFLVSGALPLGMKNFRDRIRVRGYGIRLRLAR